MPSAPGVGVIKQEAHTKLITKNISTIKTAMVKQGIHIKLLTNEIHIK